MRVHILTSTRRGGPYFWGEGLKRALTLLGVGAVHDNSLAKILASPFFESADIVHSAFPIPLRVWKKPYILSVRGNFKRENPSRKPLWGNAIKSCDVVTVPSEYLKGQLGVDAIVLHNCVFPADYKTAEHGERQRIEVVTVASLYFREKAEGIVKIAGFLEDYCSREGANLRYTVVGGGTLLDEIREKAERIARHYEIEFTGYRPNPKELLTKSDVFLYHSNLDNFPMAILEAMASGLPVVSNNVGAVPEIIDSGLDGFISESDEGYMEAMDVLLGNEKKREAVGGKARKKVEDKFSWEKRVDEYINLYKSVV